MQSHGNLEEANQKTFSTKEVTESMQYGRYPRFLDFLFDSVVKLLPNSLMQSN